MKMKRRTLLLSIAATLVLYVGSYAMLSSQGQYVPGIWGPWYVKIYMWAPYGFVSGPMGTDANHFFQAVFLPLWWIDMRFVHRWAKHPDERYPINTAFDDELLKQRKKQNQAIEGTAK